MTSPRRVLPGITYLITRRCLERRFFLKPTASTTAVFEYLLAVAANRHGILLHAHCALSNHFHLVLTDARGELPSFMQELDATLARFLNAVHGRKETVFAPGSYSAVELADEGAVLEKSAYALANPVAAGLVERASHWPGSWSAPETIGGAGKTVKRPGAFFDRKGSMPKEVTLKLAAPPQTSPDTFREALVGRISELERDAAARLESTNRHFLGVRGVKAQQVEDRASSEEEPGRRRPEVAAVDESRRCDAIAALRAFREAYRDALARLRQGLMEVLFPAGTYLLHVQLKVRCAPA